MMIYYLLFLFLVERKKHVRIEQKIIREKTARARTLQIKQKEIVIFHGDSELFLYFYSKEKLRCFS